MKQFNSFIEQMEENGQHKTVYNSFIEQMEENGQHEQFRKIYTQTDQQSKGFNFINF